MFVVHVGLHKTATTSLQKDVYPNIDGYEFVGRACKNLSDQDELYLKIANFCFSRKENDDFLFNDVRALIAQRLEKSNLLLSDEWLTADYSGFFCFKGATWQNKLDRLSCLLKDIDHKIVVSLRDPVDGIFSQYCEFLTVDVDSFYPSFEEYSFSSNDAKAYNYSRLNDFLSERFEDVIYVTFDDIKSDPSLRKIRDALGVNKLPKIGHHNKKRNVGGLVEIEKKSKWFDYFLECVPTSFKKLLKRVHPIVFLKDLVAASLAEKRTVSPPGQRLRRQLETQFKSSYDFLSEMRDS